MQRLVPMALTSFLGEHPDVDVTAAESRTPQTLRVLADGEADLGVVVDDESRDGDLVTEPLGDDSLVVIGQSGSELAGRGALTYREAAEHPQVGLHAESSLRRWIEEHAGPHAPGSALPNERRGPRRLITLVAAGVGLAVVPRRAVDPDLRLEVRDIQDPWSRRRHLLAGGTGSGGSSAAAAALAEHLRRAAGCEAVPGTSVSAS